MIKKAITNLNTTFTSVVQKLFNPLIYHGSHPLAFPGGEFSSANGNFHSTPVKGSFKETAREKRNTEGIMFRRLEVTAHTCSSLQDLVSELPFS